MTENNAFERFVADHLADDGSGSARAERLAAHIDEHSSERRQWPRWLALIKEPPMRSNSHLAVGSPTVRVAAIVVATMLLALTLAAAGIAGQRLLAASGPIVVAQDGSGTVETITEAVAMAQDGDEILVKPGTYAESVRIDKDITLRGEDRDSVTLEFGKGCEGAAFSDAECPDGTPLYRFGYGEGPYGILVEDAAPTIGNLTITGPVGRAATGSFVANGGGPSFEDITVLGFHPFYLEGGSTASVRGCELGEATGFVIEPTPALVENCTMANIVVNSTGDPNPDAIGPVLRGNGVHGITLEAPGVVEGNTVVAAPAPLGLGEPMYASGIDVIEGATFVIRGNTVSGFYDDHGIDALRGSSGEISSNVVTESRTGIVSGQGGVVVHDNVVSASDSGYVLSGTIDFAGNSAEDIYGIAVALHGDGTYMLSANRACHNGVDLRISPGADATLADDNEFCVVEEPESAR